jgi:hypothetical protein
MKGIKMQKKHDNREGYGIEKYIQWKEKKGKQKEAQTPWEVPGAGE